MPYTFKWDHAKAASNLSKHRVAFDESVRVFADPLSRTIPDPDHSSAEQRFITIGLSAQNRLLVVSHSDHGDTIRIISARLASKRERRNHEEGHPKVRT